MDITVSSRNIELNKSLRAMAEEKIGRLSRYLEGVQRAEVHFYEERNPRISEKKDVCEVTVEGHGHHIRAKFAASDPISAIDGVVAKLEHQMHKVKTKMVARHHGRIHQSVLAGKKGLSEVPLQEVDQAAVLPDAVVFDFPGGESQRSAIVKVKSFAMAPITPDEAVEKMELLGHGFYFFSNAITRRAAVVYLRHDGTVGLIDEAD